MTVIEFFHEFLPPTATAQQRRHTTHGRTYQPANVAKAAATLQAVFEQHRPQEPICGPIRLGLVWTFPQASKVAGMPVSRKSTRPDLDNLAKLALDAATKAGYWHDDAQVVELRTAKFCGELTGLAVCVEKLESVVSAEN